MIKDSAKTILCYGDSNTWGDIPRGNDRYPRSVRWPNVLQNLLGDEYEVVANGVCGRTLVALDPAKPWRCGITHLESLLASTEPIDLIVIMLGTNDVKSTYNLTAEEIAKHLEQTVALIKTNKIGLEKVPRILVVCPAPIVVPKTKDLDERMVRGLGIFPKLPDLYKEVAEKYDCGFLNAGEYIQSSKIDGYHWDPETHLEFASVIAKIIKTI